MSRISEEFNIQSLGSIIGLLLPILQIFYQFIPESTNKIFLFEEHFLLVSIFAAILSYILVIIVRSHPWFQIPLSNRANDRYQAHLLRQNDTIYSPEEVLQYIKDTPYVRRPFYLTIDNIFLVSLPITVLSFLVFFGLGVRAEFITASTNDPDINMLLAFPQAISYVLLISATTLTLGVYYIKEINQKNYSLKEKVRIDKVTDLVYKNNSFTELPHIQLIAQLPPQNLISPYRFVFKVGVRYYMISTDQQISNILNVEAYDSYPNLLEGEKSTI